MNRRTALLGLSVLLVPSLSGCLGDGAGEPGTVDDEADDADDPPADEDDTAYETPLDPEARIQIYISTDTPSDAPIVDAEEASLFDNEHLEAAFNEAFDAYEEGMEDHLGPEDHLSFETRLVHREVPMEDLDDVESTLDRDNEYTGLVWYVMYEEKTYVIIILIYE